jgi:cytochrome c oxidase subunit 1
MAYVLTTFFIMGFGYYMAETALGRAMPALRPPLAPTSLSGDASVLYTFHPPLTATPCFYIGLVLVVWARGSGAA